MYAVIAGLEHPVIRVIRLLELHVHDPGRLCAAAVMQGWNQTSVYERLEHDPQDLIGTALWLVGDEPYTPGADVVMQAAEERTLLTEESDKVSDWSSEPVTASSGTGRRLTRGTTCLAAGQVTGHCP